MCRAHKITVAVTAALWVAVLVMAVTIDRTSQGHTFTMLVGCLAVVMVPYATFPYLLRGVLRSELRELAGAFLLGYKQAQDAETEEPTRAPLTMVR